MAVGAETTYVAKHRYARLTARKARYIMDMVRHQPVERALESLQFTNRRAAPMISKVIQSALQNAIQEGGKQAEDLVIVKALADEGPTWKRWQPRARGMANPIFKRTSHLKIELADRKDVGSGKKG